MRVAPLAIALICIAPVTQAEPVWAVRPEPGLTCAGTSIPRPAIFDQPRSDASALAIAGPVVLVIKPQHVESGFVEVERPNGQRGWVQQSSLAAGPANCVPSLMSNGLILTVEAHG